MQDSSLEPWLDSGELAGSPLSEALADARADVPDQALMNKMEATLMAGLGGPVPPSGPSGSALGGAGAAGAKLTWGLALAATVMVGVGAYTLWPDASLEPTAEVNEVPIASAPEIEVPTPPPLGPLEESAGVVGAVAPAEAAGATREIDEATLLERARRTVRSRPGAALRTINEHQRRFPNGMLTEEREAIRVEALIRAGRGDRGERAAERFLARYPGSVHRLRIRSLIAN